MSQNRLEQIFNDFFENKAGLKVLHENKYVEATIWLILVIYVTVARPKLPRYMEKLAENTIFRIVVLTYILYLSSHDAVSSILVAFLFLIVIHYVNKQKVDKIVTKKE